ncbi:helix-turn-helix transcriptional regulator [Paludibacterium yongneupense]|uniref:helix-turn-helix transcriptional regulator n=1 Tax=Paludibacterium yongneupense TaxID=400061 RepID=UPI000419A9F0|nr:AraC family transcriptional regulator [Paludibacterium yongneupense]
MPSANLVTLLPSAMPGIDATMAETSRHFARHFHDQFGIGLLLRGGQRSLSGRGIVEALPGDVITVNPGEVHDGAPLDDTGRTWRMLYLDPSILVEAADELQCPVPSEIEFTHPVICSPALGNSFKHLFALAAAQRPSAPNLPLEMALCLLLEQIIGHHSTHRVRPQTSGPIKRAKARIDDDPALNITLSALAAEAGLSRFQLLRSFAREVALPPHAYLIQRRTMLARSLISSGLGLADAAIQAGFADQSHMNRAFKRFFGYTPARFAAAR